MKKLSVLVLTLAMLLSLTACGKNADNNNPNSNNENNANQNVSSETTKGEETPAPTQAAEGTLETTKVRLLCADGNYMALAILDAPISDYGVGIYEKDGEQTGIFMYDYYYGMTKGVGLWLVATDEWWERLAVGDFGVKVTNSEGESRTIYDIEPMTAEEMEAYGLLSINGYATYVSNSDIETNDLCAHFLVGVRMFCNGGIDTLDQAEEQFKFYTEDGTSLDSFLGECSLEASVSDPYVYVEIYQNASHSALEDRDGLVEQIKNCKPYMEYKGADGSTWKYPLVLE